MRIERIELDGFGRFHDASWELEDGLTVLVGANETGKTTLLNGIRALLFGFESSRDGRAWYPAVAGGRRGGRLLLRTSRGERWIVERHGERGGAGALAVRAPNGNQGGQETLDRLLHGADRDLFNNIFAFGLGELQTLASLSAEGVRGRIYGAGAGLGGTSAVDLERRLRQQMDGSFVPRGRERPLNQLLARIETLRAEVADLARQPQEHTEAHREREDLRARADQLRAEIREERERTARLRRMLDVRPAAVDLAAVSDRLAAGDPDLDVIPADAVAILERHTDSVAGARSALEAIDEELAGVRSERAALIVDEPALEAADLVAAARDEAMTRVATRSRRAELETTVTRQRATIAEQVSRAGGLDEARLIALDDSIPRVEQTRVLEQQLVEARGIAVEADRRARAAKEDVVMRERESSPATAEASELRERASAVDALNELRMRQVAATARSSGSASRVIAIVSVALAALSGVVVGIVTEQWLIGAILGLVLAVGAGAAAWRSGRGGELAGLAAERRVLLERAGLPPDAEDGAIRALADELATMRARAGIEADHRVALEVRRADLDRREREADAAREAVQTAQAAWTDWLRSAGLPDDLSPDAARQVLTAAGIARRAAVERDQLRTLLDELRAKEIAFDTRVVGLAAALGLDPPTDEAQRDAIVAASTDRLGRAREADRRTRELDASLERLGARRNAAARLLGERETALATFLSGLGCGDEDALRARHAAASERRTLQVRTRELRATIAGAAGGRERVDALVAEALAADPSELEAILAEARDHVERLEAAEREVLNRIGAVDALIGRLEATEELGSLRQELAVLQGRAGALARDWAVQALALRLLEQTRSRYERERQPAVVRAATAHFERVTDGRYARIVAPPGEGGVRVETEGGEQRATNELSRGTAEQLYLSLRFGLIEEFARQAEPLPVVMDDILVNFDSGRAARAAASVRELATRHQVLYFTCHRWTADLLDPEGTRTLALD